MDRRYVTFYSTFIAGAGQWEPTAQQNLSTSIFIYAFFFCQKTPVTLTINYLQVEMDSPGVTAAYPPHALIESRLPVQNRQKDYSITSRPSTQWKREPMNESQSSVLCIQNQQCVILHHHQDMAAKDNLLYRSTLSKKHAIISKNTPMSGVWTLKRN